MSNTKISKPIAQITFYDAFEPPLESGNYTVSIKQTVTSTDSTTDVNTSYSKTISFAVLGPRFTLPPIFIHTQFPPPDGQGEYSNVIPHIVFRRKTLPWQRQVQRDTSLEDNVTPWLALLTFDLYDPLPVIQSGTIDSLMNPPAGTTCYPEMTLDVGESKNDPCLYIDVPAALFYDIAPTLSDMCWMAHAREIDIESLDSKAGGGLDGKIPDHAFSVLVSNRLPTPGNQTMCCLVSMENMASYLPVTRGVPIAGVSTLRLAVLSTWSFGAMDLPETFAEYFANLNNEYADPITLQIPYDNTTGTTNESVKDALALGYTALNHHTRQGAATVSWYRGPLLPFGNPQSVSVPVSSPDQVVHYDPSTGMLDESLAAAWQIGQLAALNDKAFSTNLYCWKRGQTQEQIADFETNFLAGGLAVPPDSIGTGAKPVLAELIDTVLKPKLQEFVATQKVGTQE